MVGEERAGRANLTQGLCVVAGLKGGNDAIREHHEELAHERQVIVGEVVALGLGHVVGLVQLENLVVSVLEHEPLFARVHALVGHRVAALPRGGSGEGGSEVHGQRLARAGVPLAQIARDIVHPVGEQLVHIGIFRPIHLGDVIDLLSRQRPEVDGRQKVVERRATLEGRDHVLRHHSLIGRSDAHLIYHVSPLLSDSPVLVGHKPRSARALRRTGTATSKKRRTGAPKQQPPSCGFKLRTRKSARPPKGRERRSGQPKAEGRTYGLVQAHPSRKMATSSRSG